MTSSASSPVSLAIAGYVAGRVKAEGLVALVSAAYYGDGGRGTRDGLKPLIDVIQRAAPGVVELAARPGGAGFAIRLAERLDVIQRAAPGVVELAARPGGAGFAIRLAERRFPKRYEAELRRAAENYLLGEEAGEGGTLKDSLAVGGKGDGLVGRALAAIRWLFSASA